MEHNTQYKIELSNNSDTRCDVAIQVDGKDIGSWRIDGYSTTTIERPANDNGKFTFYMCETSEASEAGLDINSESERGNTGRWSVRSRR